MNTAQYHIEELSLALKTKREPHRLPVLPLPCRAVLDIGCGAGQTLTALQLPVRMITVGVDVDEHALRLGLDLAPDHRLLFVASIAELLPFAGRTFDLVICRVALSYMAIDRTLAEVARVITPGGHLWLVVPPISYCVCRLFRNLRSCHMRAVLYDLWVLCHSIAFCITGHQHQTPFRRRIGEVCFTRAALRRILHVAGFKHLVIHKGRELTATASLLKSGDHMWSTDQRSGVQRGGGEA